MFGTSDPAARAHSMPVVIWTGVIRPAWPPFFIGCQRKLSTLNLLPVTLAHGLTRIVRRVTTLPTLVLLHACGCISLLRVPRLKDCCVSYVLL